MSKGGDSAKKTLAGYRKALPDKPSQGWVAERVSELTGEDIGQQAISYWENGKVDLRNVHPRRLQAYAQVLRISMNQLAEAAGYSEAELMVEPPSTGGVKPAITFDEPEAPILPETLKAAVKRLSAAYPQLTEEVAWRMMPRGWQGDGPETEEDWMEFLTSNLKWFR